MPKGYPGTKAPHGTPARHRYHECRCEKCRLAWNKYLREWRHRTGRARPRSEWLELMPRAAHGTESKYRAGCRCDECRAAANAARARRRQTPNPARHGLYSSYSSGCRCDECREAHRVHSAEKRKAKAAVNA